MINYQQLYVTLFNAITDALRKIDTLEIAEAKQLLIQAQQKAEQLYLDSDIDPADTELQKS